MKVEAEIFEVDIENEDGREVSGISARCSRCGHQTESFGTEDGSIKRCLVLLREECPEGERNFYIVEGAEEEL